MSIAKLFLAAHICFFAHFCFSPAHIISIPVPASALYHVVSISPCATQHLSASARIYKPFVYSLFLYAPTRPILYISTFWPHFFLLSYKYTAKHIHFMLMRNSYTINTSFFCKMQPCKTIIGFSHIKTSRFYTKNCKSTADNQQRTISVSSRKQSNHMAEHRKNKVPFEIAL